MKRLHLCFLLASALVTSMSAQVYLSDAFSYADGNIVTGSSGVWTNHSGTSGDSLVQSGRYEISQSRSDDVSRQLTGYAGGPLYVSFTLNARSLPSTTAGNYFAHFKDNTTSNFYGRIYALGSGSIPGTFRLGVSGVTNIANKTYPLDLTTNLDYQVVLSWDPVNLYAQLWVNPATEGDPLAFTTDTVAGYQPITSCAFRQAANEGVLTVDDLLVGDAFATVVTNAARQPAIGIQPRDVSVFSGNDTRLFVVASGTGALTYQWLLGAMDVGVNSNVLELPAVSGANAGSYTVVVTGSGLSTTSEVANVVVNATPTVPFFTLQPESQTNSLGSTVTLNALADGTGPISYQWYSYGTNLPGQTSPTLTISNLSSALAGPYYVMATGGAGSMNSATSYVAVLPPTPTNIAYLRTLLNTSTWLPTNTTALWEIEGTVFSHTNIGSTANAQFYVHDGTAGIDVFVSGSTTLRPNAGDRVRVIGPLGVFNSLLEMNLASANANHSVTVLSSNNPMPLAVSFHDFSLTNDLPAIEALEGSLVTITNVFLQNGGGSATFTGGQTTWATNAAGQVIAVFVDSRITTVAGKPKPAFASQVTGALGQFLSNTGSPRNNGYQIILTRYEDVVAALPSPFELIGSRNGTALQMNWPASPGSTYTLFTATNPAGPWTREVFGLNFLDANGTATETNPAAAIKLYRVSSP